jgi:glycolate oxidase
VISKPEEHDSVLSQLLQALGASVITAESALDEARSDRSGKTSESAPLCVVEAKDTKDVAEVMKIANRSHTPVVVRGGGSGLAGGAIGSAGEIVLSLAKMNKIVEISTDNRWAHVQAGVINQDLNIAPAPAHPHTSCILPRAHMQKRRRERKLGRKCVMC